MECTFEFPLSNKSIIHKLVAGIGLKVVEAKIREKEEAKHRSDATGGHATVFSDKKKDAISLKIGNLLPGESATINFSVIEDLEIVGGAYAYTMPAFPDYRKHNFKKFPYDFAY